MKRITVVMALAATMFATAAHAMSVREFLTTVSTIPRNPAALFSRRYTSAAKRSEGRVRNADQAAARRAGHRPPICLPLNRSRGSVRLLMPVERF